MNLTLEMQLGVRIGTTHPNVTGHVTDHETWVPVDPRTPMLPE